MFVCYLSLKGLIGMSVCTCVCVVFLLVMAVGQAKQFCLFVMFRLIISEEQIFSEIYKFL